MISRSSGQPENDTKTLFFHPPPPFPGTEFLQLQQWWQLYCFTILGSTSIVIHSVKQRLLRNWPRSDTAISRDFLRKRWHSLVQTSFTELPNRSMISVEMRWSVTVSDFQAWTYTILNLPHLKQSLGELPGEVC